MVEKENNNLSSDVDQFFKNIDTDFETKRVAKEGVFSVLVKASQLMQDGEVESAKELLESAREKAEELHSNGQLDRRYLAAANIVVEFVGMIDRSDIKDALREEIEVLMKDSVSHQGSVVSPLLSDILLNQARLLGNFGEKTRLLTREEVDEMTRTRFR